MRGNGLSWLEFTWMDSHKTIPNSNPLSIPNQVLASELPMAMVKYDGNPEDVHETIKDMRNPSHCQCKSGFLDMNQACQ